MTEGGGLFPSQAKGGRVRGREKLIKGALGFYVFVHFGKFRLKT